MIKEIPGKPANIYEVLKQGIDKHDGKHSMIDAYMTPCELSHSDKELLLRLLPADRKQRLKAIHGYKQRWLAGTDQEDGQKLANDWLTAQWGQVL